MFFQVRGLLILGQACFPLGPPPVLSSAPSPAPHPGRRGAARSEGGGEGRASVLPGT